MKKLIQLLVFAALLTTLALPALAQTPATNTSSTAASGQDDPDAKAALYKKFLDCRTSNPACAYEAGKEYLSKYSKDGPEDQYIKYITKWVASYEKIARRQALIDSFNNKNYTDVFAKAKDVVNDYPDDVDLLYLLVQAGYLSQASGNEANNADAANYAKKLIVLVQGGKNPDQKKSKDEVLGNLNYAIGLFLQKTQPAEAATYWINAAQFEGTSKKDPQTYIFLADFYEKGDYAKMAAQYTADCKTPEQISAQTCVDLKAKVDQVVDHIIDSLARAIAYATDAKYAQAKAAWTEAITNYYKYRNNNSTTGLDALLASITTRPLPKPGEAVTPPLFPQAAPTTPATGTTTTPGATTTTTPANTTTTAPKTANPTNAKTGTAGTTTAQPAGKTSSAKSTPRRAHN